MKTRFVYALACALVSMTVRQANADEMQFTPHFITGSGVMCLTNTVRNYPFGMTPVYGSTAGGSVFEIAPHLPPGSLDLIIEVPSMMWTGELVIDSKHPGQSEFEVGSLVPSYFSTSTSRRGTSDGGTFEVTEFHRRSDGIIDLLAGNFSQETHYYGDTIWERGYIHFQVACVPEPSSILLLTMGVLASRFVGARK